MKNRIALMLISLFWFCIGMAQTALVQRVKTQLYDKGYNIMPVYKCTDSMLEYYTDAYAGETLEKFKVKFPDLTGCTDTGYAFIYFAGVNRKVCSNYSVIIIGNAQSMFIPRLYIDRNHNLDYTDDGYPIGFSYDIGDVEFDLCNAKETTGCVHITLSRYHLENQYTLWKNLEDFFMANAGTKKYLGMHNSFRIQCDNQWGADVKMGNDSFRVTVEDQNMNGIYNEPGIDHVSLVPYAQEPVSNDVKEGSVVIPKPKAGTTPEPIVMQHLSESYLLSNVTGNGQTITIKYNGKHKRAAEKLIHKRAPRFKFELLAYRKYAKLRKMRGSEVYLYFYNFKTADTSTFNQLKELYDASGGKLKIITLNYGNSPLLVKDFVKENYYMWYNGLATRKIYDRYKVDQLPMGFYLNKKLKVVKIGLTPLEMKAEIMR